MTWRAPDARLCLMKACVSASTQFVAAAPAYQQQLMRRYDGAVDWLGARGVDTAFLRDMVDPARVFTVAVENFGGSFSAEHAIGRKNQAFYDQYTPEKIRELAAGLKTITSPGPLGAMTF